ncbi:hypothetical protein AWT69_001794 [Pseudomonas putida]|nr:hypothetical protein AWT69_001794 [Pseudomonas putida]
MLFACQCHGNKPRRIDLECNCADARIRGSEAGRLSCPGECGGERRRLEGEGLCRPGEGVPCRSARGCLAAVRRDCQNCGDALPSLGTTSSLQSQSRRTALWAVWTRGASTVGGAHLEDPCQGL